MQAKQLLSAFIFLLFSQAATAQSPNPYSSIGKAGKIVTLTKGGYEEFFDEDSVQRIGSAFINLNTMKVVDIKFTKEEQRQLDNAQESRFLSVDPLTKKYPWYTPYQFAGNTPIWAIDLDGLEPAPTNINDFNLSSEERMRLFAFTHPPTALKIGKAKNWETGENISNTAARLAINSGVKENDAHEGSQRNALRHGIWQASITQQFGSTIAKEAGDAHEENPNAITQKGNILFGENSFNEADEKIDLLNNQIGRKIGSSLSKDATPKDIAKAVLKEFHENGMYTAEAKLNKDGDYAKTSIVKTKLSNTEYKNALSKINDLNDNGLTKDQIKKEKSDK